MTEEAHVPFKAQNIPKGKVSLNQVTQMEKEKKKKRKSILNNNNPHNSWTASSALLELSSSCNLLGEACGEMW